MTSKLEWKKRWYQVTGNIGEIISDYMVDFYEEPEEDSLDHARMMAALEELMGQFRARGHPQYGVGSRWTKRGD